MARRGIEVEIFTRATSSEHPPVVELAPGVLVRHVVAGPFEGLGKNDLPSQLCAFTAGVLRAEARHEPGWYDVVHSHYWLSGQVGWLARDRWGVPLVHTAHTLARVKNAALADGDPPEPMVRVIGEDQVVAEADRLVCNTGIEARELVDLYRADPARIVTIPPGVDLARFRPGDRTADRAGARDRAGRRGARLRGPDPAAQGAGRAAACRRRAARARPRTARAAGGARRGRPVGQRAGGADRRCSSSPPAWGSTTWCASSRRRPAPAWRGCSGRRTSSPCRATTSRSGWSRWRRRRAGRRWWPPGWAGCRWRCRTGGRGCWSTGTGGAVGGRAGGRGPGSGPARRAVAGAVAHAHRFSWDRTTDALLGTYEDAAEEFARRQSAVLREAAGMS